MEQVSEPAVEEQPTPPVRAPEGRGRGRRARRRRWGRWGLVLGILLIGGGGGVYAWLNGGLPTLPPLPRVPTIPFLQRYPTPAPRRRPPRPAGPRPARLR